MSKCGRILYEWFTLPILTASMTRKTLNIYQELTTRSTDHFENMTGSSLRKMSTDNQTWWAKYLAIMHSVTKSHPYFSGKAWGSSFLRVFWTSALVLYHTSSTIGQIVLKKRLTWVPNRSSVFNPVHLSVIQKIKFNSAPL